MIFPYRCESCQGIAALIRVLRVVLQLRNDPWSGHGYDPCVLGFWHVAALRHETVLTAWKGDHKANIRPKLPPIERLTPRNKQAKRFLDWCFYNVIEIYYNDLETGRTA
jgi:hypothetical protein